VFVLVFFGVVAVTGSCWLQGVEGGWAALLAGVVVGLPAAAVLLINNYRDLDADLRAGRRTLAALLGRVQVQRLYTGLMLLPLMLLLPLELSGYHGAVLGGVALPLVIREVARLKRTPIGPELNLRLADTARAGFVLSLGLAVGLVLFSTF
jgi:1,4-dihydroxy-2-naphthoate octaprenyltransferase